MREYLLSTNKYAEPASLAGPDAYAILLTKLIIMKPGTDPRHPAMGCGIGDRNRYMSVDDIPMLEGQIQEQIYTYLPTEFASNCKVHLKPKDDSDYLQIIIVSDDTKFVFDTSDSDYPIELSDLNDN